MVFVDASLALIEMKQRADGAANLGVDMGETNFAALAPALGGHGTDIHDAETLAAELAQARTRQGFTLLACHIPRKSYDGRI